MERRQYCIKRINENHRPVNWDDISRADVDRICWDEYDTYYPTRAKAVCFNDGLSLRLISQERNTVCLHTDFNDRVCEDSCLELFLQPDINCEKYFNFEFNPMGTMYLGIGTSRNDNKTLWPLNYKELFNIKPFHDEKNWGIEFIIPYEFIQKNIAGFAAVPSMMRGNFYKCGDKTQSPHYLSWNKVISDRPDFHRPECFGDLVFI